MAHNKAHTLNAIAFATHRANIRCRVVDDLFEHVGVLGICARAYRLNRISNGAGRSPETPWPLIDDLAERRNELSHGVPSDVLGLDFLGDYIAEIEAFGEAVHEIASSEALGPLAKSHAIQLPQAVKVINHKIVCVSNDGHSIALGDSLIAETGDQTIPFRIGRIKRIEVDRNEVQSIPAGEQVMVGLEVEMRTKQYHTHHLVPSAVVAHIGTPENGATDHNLTTRRKNGYES